ncbi:hypothetical protein GLAREA_12699 [Glarea lozoyensis ATCC 20868]|uniref:Uncharacterized protein n=1 Tax=Glarea lozoyensis (strain ATCC 20868 / MF5171) TaxID=1116229 RepID=S3DHA0_GLAL2|nr:uncharacterized protein GLAREA_12699 [Glarea lozoyensis ATCC 20868]EPE31396.1 hypothetical protein GLAREA_12699 [Glarea lozoyensis ATCC 20868]
MVRPIAAPLYKEQVAEALTGVWDDEINDCHQTYTIDLDCDRPGILDAGNAIRNFARNQEQLVNHFVHEPRPSVYLS